MDRAVRELRATAWLAGLRRSQGFTRAFLPAVQPQNKLVKIHPILDWDNRRVHRYLTEHGYASVGDWHSTSKLEPGMQEEETRFGGLKRECGLHEPSGRGDFSI